MSSKNSILEYIYDFSYENAYSRKKEKAIQARMESLIRERKNIKDLKPEDEETNLLKKAIEKTKVQENIQS